VADDRIRRIGDRERKLIEGLDDGCVEFQGDAGCAERHQPEKSEKRCAHERKLRILARNGAFAPG
jgi:hypothetical protein